MYLRLAIVVFTLTAILAQAWPAEAEEAAPADAEEGHPSPQDPRDAAEAALIRGLLEAEERRLAAQNEVIRGRQLLKARLYEAAYEAFQRANSFDPANEEARRGAAEARRYIEARSPAVADAISREIERARISEQHQMMEALNHIEEAQRLLDMVIAPLEGASDEERARVHVMRLQRLEEAAERLHRARLQLEGLPARANAQPHRDTVAALEVKVRELKAQNTAALNAVNREIALRIAKDNQAEVAAYVQRQKAELLREARLHRDMRQYDKAERIVLEVLRMDPADSDADSLLLEVQRLRRQYRDEKIRDTEIEERRRVLEGIERRAIPEVSPDRLMRYPSNWDELIKRKALGRPVMQMAAEDDESTRKIQQALLKRFTVEFNEQDIKDVLDHLKRISGVDIIYRPPEGEAEPPTVTLSVQEMQLENILRWVMTITGLNYEIRRGAIYVTSAAGLQGEKVTEIYDVRDIAIGVSDAGTMPGVEGEEEEEEGERRNLDEIIRLVLAADFGEGGGDVSVDENYNLMVVHTREVQRKVVELLAKLREAQAIQISVTARFLTVTDDFWEMFRSAIRGPYENQFGNFYTTAFTPGGVNKERNPFSTTFTPSNHFDEFRGLIQHRQLRGLQSVMGSNLGSNWAPNAGITALLSQGGWLHQIQCNWLLQAMKETQRADTLFAPHIIVYNNKFGWILWESEIPYIRTYQLAPAGVDLEPVIDVLREGATLQVRPTISADKKYITLDIWPRVTRLSSMGRTTMEGAGHVLPIDLPMVFTHDARTIATLPDGGSILMSGLAVNVHSRGRHGVPLLQDIPLIGNVFSDRSLQKDRRSFVIVVNARAILLDEEEAKQTR